MKFGMNDVDIDSLPMFVDEWPHKSTHAFHSYNHLNDECLLDILLFLLNLTVYFLIRRPSQDEWEDENKYNGIYFTDNYTIWYPGSTEFTSR